MKWPRKQKLGRPVLRPGLIISRRTSRPRRFSTPPGNRQPGEKRARKAGGKASFVRRLLGRDLHWRRWNLGLAVLRRGDQADNRDNDPGTWLVAGGEARELGPTAWVNEAAGQSRIRCRLVVVAGNASTGGYGRLEGGRPRRHGPATADSTEPCSAAPNRRADRRRPRQAGARDQ